MAPAVKTMAPVPVTLPVTATIPFPENVRLAFTTRLPLVGLLLVVTPAGNVRIGRGETKPEYGTASYFSMLFAAGMGVGLLFWGVAEPLAGSWRIASGCRCS